MSAKSVQKLPCQNIGKKRKSCFEITNVAFQNHQDDNSDDDDDTSCFVRKEQDCCNNCNSHLDENSKENLNNCSEDVTYRTRFKVLKNSCIRGRWSCSDSLESAFHLAVTSSVGDVTECNYQESNHTDGNDSAYEPSTLNKTLPLDENKVFVVAGSNLLSPDLLKDPKIQTPNGFPVCSVHLNETSHLTDNLHLNGLKGQNLEQFFPQLETIIQQDAINLSLRGVGESLTECSMKVSSQQWTLDMPDCSEHFNINDLRSGEDVADLCVHLSDDMICLDKTAVHMHSSEDISDKISKALDLAKEHVIMTAHGEIERLKEQINDLQSTIKELEEENRQLRGSGIHKVSVNDDLIDLK